MGWDPECVACKDEGEGSEASVAHVQTCSGGDKPTIGPPPSAQRIHSDARQALASTTTAYDPDRHQWAGPVAVAVLRAAADQLAAVGGDKAFYLRDWADQIEGQLSVTMLPVVGDYRTEEDR